METNLVAKLALNEHELMVLASEMDNRRRSAGFAYVLLGFFGWTGASRLYLGSVGAGAFQFVTGPVFIGLLFAANLLRAAVVLNRTAATSPIEAIVTNPGVLAAIGAGLLLNALIVLADLFLIPGEVRHRNERIEWEIIEAIRFTAH